MKRAILFAALVIVAVFVLLLPILTSAAPGDPGAPAQTVSSGIPRGTIIQGVLGIIGALLTWLLAKLSKSTAAGSAANQLVTLADSVRQKVWDALTPEVQTKIATGDWKRAQSNVVDAVQKAVLDAVGQGAITSLAKALNLPAATVIGTIATYVVEHFLAAHDPMVSSVSANVYPVSPPIMQGTTLLTESAHMGP